MPLAIENQGKVSCRKYWKYSFNERNNRTLMSKMLETFQFSVWGRAESIFLFFFALSMGRAIGRTRLRYLIGIALDPRAFLVDRRRVNPLERRIFGVPTRKDGAQRRQSPPKWIVSVFSFPFFFLLTAKWTWNHRQFQTTMHSKCCFQKKQQIFRAFSLRILVCIHLGYQLAMSPHMM